MFSETSSSYLGTIQGRNVTTEILTDTQRHPRHPKRLFEDVWPFRLISMVVAVVFWCLMVSVSVSCCLEIWGGCLRSFSKGIWVLFMDRCKVWCIWGCIWVFRPCIVQQTLFFGKALKVKIIHTWHFWNVKIPKPPYEISLKIIGL